MSKLSLFLLFSIVAFNIYSQELNCSVQVIASPQITTDKKIFETMQTAIYEFLNNRRWTNDVFLNQERIEGSLIFNITEQVSSDQFKGTLQIQLRRPIYKSSYNSTVLNYNDVDLDFRYTEQQNLEFSESSHLSNLTSLLAFYAYIMIGLDYDSFSLEGGTQFYQKAQAIVNNAQNAAETGWQSSDDTRNRYWLIENLLNPIFKPLRQALYKYHRKGLDAMSDNSESGRAEITQSLELLRNVHVSSPGSFLMQVFFNAKSDEMVNIYSQAFAEEKAKVAKTLVEIDPGNAHKYQILFKS